MAACLASPCVLLPFISGLRCSKNASTKAAPSAVVATLVPLAPSQGPWSLCTLRAAAAPASSAAFAALVKTSWLLLRPRGDPGDGDRDDERRRAGWVKLRLAPWDLLDEGG